MVKLFRNKKIELLQNNCMQLNKELAEMQGENTSLKTKIAELEETFEVMKEQIEELRCQVKDIMDMPLIETAKEQKELQDHDDNYATRQYYEMMTGKEWKGENSR